MIITSQFDSGNIQVIRATTPDDITLSIKKDTGSDFYQWFHFKLQSTPFIEHKIAIIELAESAYPKGWEDYRAVASYDRKEWFRVDTSFDGNNLTINFTPEHESVYFAYFTPYSYERHQDFISEAQMAPDCQLHLLGQTLDGRDISMLQIGEASQEKKSVWITARQHPGETMAEWLTEGLVYRLLDEDDGIARSLLEHTVFYIIPNANPDGSVRGHLRTNALGINLNREWASPSLEKSPEVFYILQAMQERGVDLYLDVHGDEVLPYNFVAGSEGIPNYNQRLIDLESTFKSALLLATPEFQDEIGYPKDPPGEANLTVASNAVANKYNCLAFTLEMPFKDNNNLPDLAYGWSATRCKQLGEDVLIAIHSVVKVL